MKTASPALIAHLAASKQFAVVDLYTLSIVNTSWSAGLSVSYTVYRYSGAEYSVTTGGHTYTATDAIFSRQGARQTIGLEVATMDVTVNATGAMVIKGIPFMQAVARGVLDSAILQVDRAFVDANHAIIGTVNWFTGRVAKVQPSRTGATITVNSLTELLNINVPRNVYQAACQNALYDSACGLSMAGFAYSGTVSEATQSIVDFTGSALSMPTGFFELGGLVFTSGSNSGECRTVKYHRVSGSVYLSSPLKSVPVAGDTFELYAGCDKTMSTCTNKFSNIDNFKGQPFIPTPETSL